MFEVRLPSGLAGTMRKLKMRDLAVFTNKHLARKPGLSFESALLRECWVDTTETGIYAFDGRPPWQGPILHGDIFEALRQLRIESWGDHYEFDMPCQGALCDADIQWELSLSDLKVIPLSDEAKEGLLQGNRFPFTLPECGKRIVYSLPTGQSQIRMDKMIKEHGAHMYVILAARLHEVEGIDAKGHFVDFVGDLSPQDGWALRDELERLNCGVDTDIQVFCQRCGLEQTASMPTGAGFFMPPKAQKP